VNPNITPDMIERAAAALKTGNIFGHAGPKGYWAAQAEVALTAALAGRTVVDLPEPDTTDSEGDPAWTVPGVIADEQDHVVAYVHHGKPLISAITSPDDPFAVEAYALALMAAARTSRRLAAESSGDGESR
jgi:hypothetical protein